MPTVNRQVGISICEITSINFIELIKKIIILCNFHVGAVVGQCRAQFYETTNFDSCSISHHSFWCHVRFEITAKDPAQLSPWLKSFCAAVQLLLTFLNKKSYSTPAVRKSEEWFRVERVRVRQSLCHCWTNHNRLQHTSDIHIITKLFSQKSYTIDLQQGIFK